MIIQSFKDILSSIDYEIIDNNGIEKLEKVCDYLLRINLDKILIWHITDHIKTMFESNRKLEEDYIELRKLILHWYDVRYNEDKYKYNLPVCRVSI